MTLLRSKAILLVTFLSVSVSAAAVFQDSTSAVIEDTTEVKIAADDPILLAMDQSWMNVGKEWLAFSDDSVSLNIHGFAPDSIPSYADSVYAKRIAVLNEGTPMELDYNNYVQAYINVYAKRRRDITEQVLGLAALYYPLFEEQLDRFDMPLELKHLAVVESGLNPSARSPVGATGLWQFMYTTGKVYNLEVNSFVDERRDPYQSTIAACQYMQYLHGLYDDWNLALAAYNSGPGNVNKAIRRSGGKRTYWEIRNYLPRETRGYVPAFIAVNYIMKHAADHNIYPVAPPLEFPEVDTLQICRRTTFDQISKFTGVSVEELEVLNPAMKRNIIPKSEKCQTVYLPVEAAGLFLANQDALYNFNTEAPQAVDGYIVEDVIETHVVRSGDVLGKIAERYGVGVSSVREWNNIRGNRIYPGQKLEIHKTIRTKVGETTAQKAEPKKESKGTDEKEEIKTTESSSDIKVHIVQSGDTLWDIAKLYPGVSMDDIKSANSGLDSRRLKPGQKIKIPPAS
ncbi:MAG TPA: LysM peptidoglycan-binding domain-containing protein [Cryomorphaceae bacterium]|nr:LysM peptidoglycan-binding domain-containing protein [Cryomorphaceae bacterium]